MSRAVELPIIGLQVVGKNVAVPLKSCEVKAALNGYVVGLDSTLKYVNHDTSPLEVLFRFPVDQSYAVVGLEAVIAGKRIKAQIKEKEEAKQAYDDAIASGFTAAFAEEKSGDIFSISLGNLPPNAEAELNLKLVGELPIDAEGAIRFSVPAVLKPRYTPIGSTDPLAPSRENSVAHGQAPAVHSFEMVLTKEGVASVTSPTHKILEKLNDDSIHITLAEEDAKPLDKDLIVLVCQSNPHLPKAVCELGDPASSQRSYMGAPAVMLSFFPKFESKRAQCEFIFLVDRSGSMRGSYINSASETLILFLKSIPSGCIFNIIGFGSTFRSLFPHSVEYNQEHLDVAMQHAETLQADLGGTELFSPLKDIFDTPLTPGLPRQVFVLTDGSVSNTNACINEVKKNAAHSRVFTFGIGSGASTALVNGLAKAGNGNPEFVKEGERMQPKVISSLKRALQPSVTDLEVDFQLPYGFDAFQAPDKIPTIFNGDKIVVYGIFKSKAVSDTPLQAGLSGTATLKGQILNTPMTHSVSFDIPAPPIVGEEKLEYLTGFQMPVIHHLAAKSLLSDWSNGYGWSSTALQAERKEETVKLSIESSVISEHTAFVAYDTNQSQLIEGAIKVWDLTATMADDTSVSHSMGIVHRKVFGAAAPRSRLAKTGSPRLQQDAPVLLSFACPPPPGAGMVSGPPPAPTFSSMQHAPIGPPPPPAMGSGPPPARPMQREYNAPAGPPPPRAMGSGHSPQKKTSGARGARVAAGGELNELTVIISLQQAAGFWSLKEIADKIIKKRENVLGCPPGVSADAWGTLLALSFLEIRCPETKDEWELIAMKADSWLESQTLPEGVTLASLKEAAKKIIKAE